LPVNLCLSQSHSESQNGPTRPFKSAARGAEREKTARLKLLREAKEAADVIAKEAAKAAGVA